MPNQPKTPLKCFRVPDDLYQAAMRRATENGETLTDAVRRFLREYVEAERAADESSDLAERDK